MYRISRSTFTQIVIDLSFQNTVTGETVEAIAKKYGFSLAWHEGFELSLAEVPGDFRGSEMPVLARRILENYAENHGYLDAATIGLAAVSVGPTLNGGEIGDRPRTRSNT